MPSNKRALYHLFVKIMISGSYWMLNLRKIYQKKIKDPNIISQAKFLKKPSKSSQNSSSKFEKKSDQNYYHLFLLFGYEVLDRSYLYLKKYIKLILCVLQLTLGNKFPLIRCLHHFVEISNSRKQTGLQIRSLHSKPDSAASKLDDYGKARNLMRTLDWVIPNLNVNLL